VGIWTHISRLRCGELKVVSKHKIEIIAAQKKLEVENQALSAREKDRLAAESKIKAAVLMGSDEKKVKEQLVKVFSDVDSLRYKKADAMYLELQKEAEISYYRILLTFRSFCYLLTIYDRLSTHLRAKYSNFSSYCNF